MEQETEPFIAKSNPVEQSKRNTTCHWLLIISISLVVILLYPLEDLPSSTFNVDRPDGFFDLKNPSFECAFQKSRNRPCFENKTWNMECATPKNLEYCKKHFPMHITMIGDSQMYWLAIAIQRFFLRVQGNPKCHYKKAHSSGCSVPEFLGFSKTENRIEGKEFLEGNFGKKCINSLRWERTE